MRTFVLILASLLAFNLTLAEEAAAAQDSAALQKPASKRPDPQKPHGDNLKTPPAWRVRLDRPDSEVKVGWEKDKVDIWFVNMAPGWHITTGPAAILWDPASTASGNYRASATIDLFDPKGHLEGYGVFFGGTDLESEGQSYSYFLLRNDGKFLVKKRRGAATEVVQDWTLHEAIARYGPESKGSVQNVLAVEVHGDAVGFFVNGKKVAGEEGPATRERSCTTLSWRWGRRIGLTAAPYASTVTQFATAVGA